MPIIGAILSAVLTGLFYWVVFGNGKEAIMQWLDSRDEAKRQKDATDSAVRAREDVERAALRQLGDPREAATALMTAVAEARGEMTPEQAHEIKAQMRTVLGYTDDLDNLLALGRHAARTARTPEAVLDETLPLFRERLTESEQDELVAMLEAVAAMHGGATERQTLLINRARERFLAERRPHRPG